MTPNHALRVLRKAALCWKADPDEKITMDGHVFRPYAGICFHMSLLAGNDAREFIQNLMHQWPARDLDCEAYPVGGYSEYDAGKNSSRLWDNPRRWELLDWLILETTPGALGRLTIDPRTLQ